MIQTITVEWPDVKFPSVEDLPTEDGIPMETPLHRAQMNLLIDSVHYHWRDRTDYYVGGNMFIYFSASQIRNQDYRGPDFYLVKNVDGTRERKAWLVWEEEGRYPDLIIELLSESTAEIDKTVKKRLYEQTFRTLEYYCYDLAAQELIGWRLGGDGRYANITPDPEGRLWSEILQVWLGLWDGAFQKTAARWLRFYNESGQVIPVKSEAEATRADQEAARADQEAARADQAEAELARLRAELERLKKE